MWLSWRNPEDDAVTGYKVRYGKTGAHAAAAWTPIAGADAGTTGHLVTGLDNDEGYSFQVRAVNVVGDGPATAWATATPPLPGVRRRRC